ncbi:hypothetical protein H6G54_14125 [Anabaena cylindrica FACHB-243]|uniref:Uncharacterized protein n=1 Tax=Anabaena cylindrica (strain ATCC 27899 / PCC 7122) TaxID=272123 RepID=K9ZJV5_ANACC|nr:MULTISPECIES: hypothetical protein [Anabaena]AFZ59523.1 hypothetical protein Anacy_4156 [Anabaena cylindrica PCC 7122]MBD2418813.1 hypothetical protein [Anabaena cylindrica FACHB-243]MBY5283319.1 hypothetical protein [Anabaena sp. CCAP 1446/1C]MBY5306795.1 hypothetical protein [Anabaena sp. CCAP 1446/1C]MCM2406378.1 hypothetical protein [Anabaena sp. CCAP 1446/1C]
MPLAGVKEYGLNEPRRREGREVKKEEGRRKNLTLSSHHELRTPGGMKISLFTFPDFQVRWAESNQTM